MRTKLHFSRFEFKYVLTQRMREELEAEIQYFVELDPFTADREGGKYFVRSLYYDTPTLCNYFEKVDGMMHRAKFRLRTYTDVPDDDTPRFLEIKGRHNNLVFKHRTPVELDGPTSSCGEGDAGTDLSAGRYVDPSAVRYPMTAQVLEGLVGGPIANQFQFELARKALRPVMLVDYWRRPYVSKYDPEFRMTMDEGLSGTACEQLFPGPHAPRRLALAGFTILVDFGDLKLGTDLIIQNPAGGISALPPTVAGTYIRSFNGTLESVDAALAALEEQEMSKWCHSRGYVPLTTSRLL